MINSLKSANILIAEDNATNRKLLRAVLEAEGFHVFAVVDGIEALEVLAKESVVAVISDILMPRMDGYRLCYEVRKSARLSSLPFIFYTATYLSPGDEKLGLDLGADAFIRKPAASSVLIGSLKKIVEKPDRGPAGQKVAIDDLALMREYSERLVAKLEEKNIELTSRTEELNSVNEHLRQLLAHTPAVIYRHKIEGQRIVPLFGSDNIEQLLGFTAAEAMSFEWWRTSVHPEDRDRLQANLTEVMAGKGYSTEYRVRHKEGHYRWVLDQNRVISDSFGEPREIVGVWTDITERKQAEEELKFRNAVLSTQLETSMDGILVVDADARVISYNQRFVDIWGIPSDLLADKNDEPLLKFVTQKVADEKFFLERVRHLYESRREKSCEEILLKDGRTIDRYSAPMFGQNGHYYGRVWYFRDISDRKVGEESCRRLSNIVQSSNDAIIGETLDGIVTSWNNAAERIFGFTAQEMIGNSINALLPADRVTEERVLLAHVAGGDLFQMETRRMRKDGSEIDIVTTASPIKDGQGRTVGASKIARDITQRKQVELKLEETHAELLAASREAGKAEFATGVLHNVGNVLNSVNIAASSTADRLKNTQTARLGDLVNLLREHESNLGEFFANNPKGKLVPGYLDQLFQHFTHEKSAVLEEMAKLLKNVEHIKGLVRIQQNSAKTGAVSERVVVTELINDALEMNANGLANGNVQVIRDFATLPPIFIEKNKLLQIVINLVRNGMQACTAVDSTDKRLTARAETDGNSIQISIIDTGCGIAPENLDKIWTHGFTTKKDGHGFGLHSASLAIKEMGGTLTVQSGGPGRGATFTVTLPANSNKEALISNDAIQGGRN